MRQLRVIGAEMECSWTLARLELLEGSGRPRSSTAARCCGAGRRATIATTASTRWPGRPGVFAERWAGGGPQPRRARARVDRRRERQQRVARDARPRPRRAGALGRRCRRRRSSTSGRRSICTARSSCRTTAPSCSSAPPPPRATPASTTRPASGSATRACRRAASARARCRRRPSDSSPSSAAPARLAPAGAAGLTPRQLQVIRRVAEGRTNREIATELYLSVRTVDMHVRHSLIALGCRSRMDAARKAAGLGLLEPA